MSEKQWVKTYAGGKPNYCTPEETRDNSSWVGLTNEEVKYLISHFDWRAPKEQFVSVIEAKLKEKNGG